MGGKVRVATSDYGAKVIFECADATFGGVVAVGVRGTSWKSTLYLQKDFCIVWEHLLSRMLRVGYAPCWSRCLWHFIEAEVISRA